MKTRLLLLLMVFAACSEETPQQGWSLQFNDEALRERVSDTYAEILRGGCEGERIFTFVSYDEPRRLPRLEPGTYGFFARAGDEDCFWYAGGCVEHGVPLEQSAAFEVVMQPLDQEVDSCAEIDCSMASCELKFDSSASSEGCDDVQALPVAAYDFREANEGGVTDVSRQAPQVDLQVDERDPPGASFSAEEGLTLDGGRVEASQPDSAELGQRLRASRGFSISVWARAGHEEPVGPARLVTYSSQAADGGFTIGQFGNEMHARVKTELTPTSGSTDREGKRVYLSVSFSADALHHYVLTYNERDGQMRFYYDGRLAARRIQLFEGAPAQLAWDESSARLGFGDEFGPAGEAGPDRQWDGAIVQTSLYAGVLSAQEVLGLFDAGEGEVCGADAP